MPNSKSKLTAMLGIGLAMTGMAVAQSSDSNQALINALIKKGVLSDQEAKDITAEIAKEQSAAGVQGNGDKFLQKLTFSSRFQTQYVGLDTQISGVAHNPVYTEHFLLRRMLFGVNAQFGDGLSSTVVYDLSNDSFDKAVLTWKQSDRAILDVGLAKAPFGYEESAIGSGDLKAIERSEITRYIDEANNGRRLGAASYRTGVFLHGSESGFFYNIAVTNPERNEYSGDSTNTAILVNTSGGVGSTGGAATNKVAYYGTGGYGGSYTENAVTIKYKFGYEYGFVPDQGGPGATIGTGRNISLNGGYVDLSLNNLSVVAEFEQANDDSGIANHVNAKPHGFWVQPSYKITPHWEAVVQYSTVNSDGRGVALSDVVRSAPSGGTMETSDEWYFGGNWYIKGNDVKLQAGYIHADSNKTLAGAPATAQTNGVRSQLQFQF